MNSKATPPTSNVRDQLLQAALECFLSDEYHRVTTRAISERANTSVAMIRYYFGNKEGLYEEMISETLGKLIDVLDTGMLSTPKGFTDFFKLYYNTMLKNPAFPKLILKVIALNQGPGRRFILQLLERGRSRGRKTLEQSQAQGTVGRSLNPDIVRMAFVSLAMTPMLLKNVFEEQLEYELDQSFLDNLAEFNGHLFACGLAQPNEASSQ